MFCKENINTLGIENLFLHTHNDIFPNLVDKINIKRNDLSHNIEKNEERIPSEETYL